MINIRYDHRTLNIYRHPANLKLAPALTLGDGLITKVSQQGTQNPSPLPPTKTYHQLAIHRPNHVNDVNITPDTRNLFPILPLLMMPLMNERTRQNLSLSHSLTHPYSLTILVPCSRLPILHYRR